ncbi:MAG: cbb3-type cytochrome c oxidase subunit I [Dokdonella sp.]|uniref:cbb3-type cytochrome c oxidase subunit I n=1 Tax=Dokdonella sp. TaxID=2291710 RepID=UPI0025C34533|nr:cbb3-type cytochrome c oxidase subunit I [Dokdonella sp.]MBX3699532.1 cbb3-type cytochrome c oxidase subunit I [Dokdonella sp.]
MSVDTMPAAEPLYRSQRLALRYFTAAIALFGVMIVFGLLSAAYYLFPSMLFNTLNFNTSKIMHIDVLVIWLLMAFVGAVYWYLPKELGREMAGIRAAEITFWVFCVAVALVAATFLLVQYGSASEFTLWFINQGRKYVEAPRWAAIGIVAILLVFSWNVVGTCVKARRMTGIMWVMVLDLIPLVVVYLDAFPADTNMSTDLYWWWWLVHMWVESTWEVLIGCIMALVLMDVMGTSRRIVEAWLYIEVMLVLGAGILGLGHHYFWIGTPQYWLAIGGFFSALEPLPLLGMVVHAVYDAGMHRLKTNNQPAFYWITAEALGNFIGAGIWGFMMTLPQINLFSHGTQWTVSHGHFAFYGAYVCGVIAVMYVARQRVTGVPMLAGRTWRWGFGLLNLGMVGMVMALLLAGMAQAFYGRAIGGSTLMAFTTASENLWFKSGMYARMLFGVVFAAGYVALVYDLLRSPRRAPAIAAAPEPA